LRRGRFALICCFLGIVGSLLSVVIGTSNQAPGLRQAVYLGTFVYALAIVAVLRRTGRLLLAGNAIALGARRRRLVRALQERRHARRRAGQPRARVRA
jgi:hypothetical protein